MPTPTLVLAPTLDFFKQTSVSSQQQVPAVVRDIHQKLMSHVPVDDRLRIKILKLAEECPAHVVLTLLRYASSCDRAAATMWKTIGSWSPAAEKVFPTLVCVMEHWPLHSTPSSDGHNKAIFALAATLVLRMIAHVPKCHDTIILHSSRLFAALLFRVSITTEQVPEDVENFWRAHREEHRIPTKPNRSKTITEPQELIAQLIRKARVRLCELAGCDFTCIHLPVKLYKEGRNSPKILTKEMFEHLLQSNARLQLSLDSYRGQISGHAPSHKLLNEEFHLIPREKRSRRPLKALTVFMDASGASHKSVMTWRNPQTQHWEADVEFVEGSPQVAELAAVVRAFEKFSEPINLVTDSAYVAGVVSRAEQAVLKEIDNEHLFRLLSKLIYLISHREHPFYVMHVRSHTDLPGEIAEGNRQADSLAAPVENAHLPDVFQQAKLSHQQYHQNVPGLIRQFQLTRSQARAIVATCPNCPVQAMPSMGVGVNPRGLGSCEVWQTDITHIPSFGHLKYVHVSIDTHSGAVYASAHAGEKTEHAKKHLVQAFSVLGIPKEINTDNGPAYTSKGFLEFVQQWGVEHKTGIPHSPTGQAVVERAHQTLKQVLARQSSTTVWMSPHEKLCKAMFTINFLNCSFENMSPPVVRHFNSGNQFKLSQRPPVMIRDPETWETKGPYELVTWGHGYACVATPSGPQWIPQKWVKPFVPKNPSPAEGDKRQVAVASKRRRRWMEEKESS
ncbi:hypothetical protein DUI87_00520 [Hirundo rustica rustica]|uniref:RNA-directed DNA polymerase n=1 Tax=Hirundo rustica rustica TaxID=333673 RepID=A0A3M0L9N7_HIRRU|nr:hypothetical protein DUI87_00520 [Hirundo rustica rustica]